MSFTRILAAALFSLGLISAANAQTGHIGDIATVTTVPMASTVECFEVAQNVTGSVGSTSGTDTRLCASTAAGWQAAFGFGNLALANTASLTSQVSGVLPVANGGTGLGTLTANGLFLGNGASNPTFLAPVNGDCVVGSGGAWTAAACGGGSGTVTSVGLTAPGSLFAVTGTPITSSGTLGLTLTNQTTNLVFASPNGSTGAPTFRAIAAADMPSAFPIIVANAGTTGTTLNALAKLTGAPSTAVIATTSDTIVRGIVIGGAGTTGNAQIAVSGQASCIFDGATTAGDYIQISTTTGGDCHDTGSSTFPSSGQVLGKVLSTHGSGGTYAMVVANEVVASSGGATTITLGVGLTNGSGYNTGTQTITNSSTVSPQLTYEVHTTSYTLASTDGAKLPTFTAAGQTATFPNPGAAGSTSFQFGYDGTHSYSITTVAGTASIYGCGTTGTAVSGLAYQIQLVPDGTNYQCIPSNGATGSISGLTTNTIPKATSSSGIGNSSITDDGTNTVIGDPLKNFQNQTDVLTISTATFTPVVTAGVNQQMTLVHASCPCTIANPTGIASAIGQTGMLDIIQSSTGSDTVGTWGSQFITPGGTSTLTLSTAANAVDHIAYRVIDSTHVLLGPVMQNATH